MVCILAFSLWLTLPPLFTAAERAQHSRHQRGHPGALRLPKLHADATRWHAAFKRGACFCILHNNRPFRCIHEHTQYISPTRHAAQTSGNRVKINPRLSLAAGHAQGLRVAFSSTVGLCRCALSVRVHACMPARLHTYAMICACTRARACVSATGPIHADARAQHRRRGEEMVIQ